MTEHNRADAGQTDQTNAEPKKISLAEAVKQKLAQKKQAQAAGGKQSFHANGGGPTMEHQNNAKKVNTTRKKLGG